MLSPGRALVGGVRGSFAGRQQVAPWAPRARRPFVRSWPTWSLVAPFTDALLRSAVFVNEQEGFAAGNLNENGISLWHTLDGGTPGSQTRASRPASTDCSAALDDCGQSARTEHCCHARFGSAREPHRRLL